MRILAIDPGDKESAWVVYCSDKQSIESHGFEENAVMLNRIRTGWWTLIDLLAIEMVNSMGMAVGKSTFETCVWIGRFQEAFESRSLYSNTALITRNKVKHIMCGSMRASDSNIRMAVVDKLGAPGTKKKPGVTYGISKHKWQALAVALTAVELEEGNAQ